MTIFQATLRTIPRQDSLEIEGPISAEGGAGALLVLVERHPDLQAVFFSSDVLAVGAVQECHRRGWAIPGRIAIAGYGDMELSAQLYPPLTTVRVDRHGMGRRAVRQLLDRLGGAADLPSVVHLGFEIVDRGSA